MTTPNAPAETEAVSSNWCGDCGRMKKVGCVCGLTFAERMKLVSVVLPASFRAVKG